MRRLISKVSTEYLWKFLRAMKQTGNEQIVHYTMNDPVGTTYTKEQIIAELKRRGEY